MKIAIDTSQVRAKASDIRLLNNELQKTMEEMEDLIFSVNGSWQGDSERAFASRIVFVKREFSNIASFLNDYANLLQSFADAYDEYDDTLCSRINLI